MTLGVFFWTARINPHTDGRALEHAAGIVHEFNRLKRRDIDDIFIAGAFGARGSRQNRKANSGKGSHALIVTTFGAQGNSEKIFFRAACPQSSVKRAATCLCFHSMIMRFRFLVLTVCMLGAAWQVFSFNKPAVAATQTIPTAPSFKPVGANNTATAGAQEKTAVKATAAGWVKLASGQTAAVVRFEIENGWHMYWQNPGDSGAPPLAQLQAVNGWTLLEPIFPRPSILKTPGDTEFMYDTSWEWLLPVQGPDGVAAPACSFDLSWMVCKERCIVGRARVEFAAATGEIPAAGLARLGRSLATLGATATFNSKDQTSTISGSTSSAAAPTVQFIPAVMPGVSLQSAGPFPATVANEKFTLTIPIEIQPHNALGKPIVFKGLLQYGQSNSDRCEIINLPLNIQGSQP